MDTAEMAVVVSMQEDVSSKMPKVTSELQKTKAATRELAAGVAYMGTTFLGLGVAMQNSNNQMAKSAGDMMVMVGGILTAVGSAAQFVTAAARIVNALKAINMQLIIQKALSGPGGWLLLAGAVAAGGAAAYGLSRSESRAQQPVNVNTTVTLDGRVIGEAARQQIVLTQQRNGTSGVK